MRGFIDLHCHILPGLDDGPNTLEQSIAMAKMAVEYGTSTIIATPHTKVGHYHNPPEKVNQALLKLRAALQEHKIPLNVLPGNEIRIHQDVLHTIQQREAYTLGDGNRYLLLELPFSGPVDHLGGVIRDLIQGGYIPIIPHPERTDAICENPLLIQEWVDLGALTQLTADSLFGKFGELSLQVAHTLIEHQLTHFLASDGHNINNRKPILQLAYQEMEKKYGTELVELYQQNAEAVLSGQKIGY